MARRNERHLSPDLEKDELEKGERMGDQIH
jgi:hypothetical protein